MVGFDNISVKDIICVTKYIPDRKSWKCKNRTNHIMGIQLRGTAVHTFSNKKITIGERCIYFLNQCDDYQAIVLEQTEANSVHFTTYKPIETESFCFKVKDESHILNHIENIEKHLFLISSSKNIVCQYFYELCELFNVITKKNYHSTDRRIISAKEYIDLHFKEKDCLDKAADVCGISRRRFNDIFKHYMNCTPNEYVIEKKCTLAKNLLYTNMLSITQISEMCGFDNIYYFSKVFKKETGLPPSKYKKIIMDEL